MRSRDEHLGIAVAFDFDRAPRELSYRALYRRIAASVAGFRRAGVAQGPQVLARIKGECRNVAKAACKLSLIAGEMRLGAVFYDP